MATVLTPPVSFSPWAIGVAGLKFSGKIELACGRRPSLSMGALHQMNANFRTYLTRDVSPAGIFCSWPPEAMKRILATGLRWPVSESGKCSCSVESTLPSEDGNITVENDLFTEKEAEEVARERNWKLSGWAPWEELRTPEAQFALDSLVDAGDEEDPVVSWDAFQNLDKKQQQEEEPVTTETKGAPETGLVVGSKLDGPLFVTLIPPRDWPPPGWKVDAKELAYLREAYSSTKPRMPTDINEESNFEPEDAKFGVPRWEMFLKQYHEWVAANKHTIEQETLEMEEEYYPGSRKTGEEYKEGMYELPFVYPGQHYWGIVTYVNLYEGAFVDYGGVHDGWVPIMDNDWYEIRHHIKLGMRVHVEVIAKRDPYRFRFPVEMRFVDPNIDHLIFRRFKYPPIFGRKDDTNLDEVSREANRPFYPELRPELTAEEEEEAKEAPIHPYIKRLWVVHEAEQMTLDDEDGLTDDEEWDDWATEEEDDPTGEWAMEPGLLHESEDGFEVPTVVLHVEDKYMDLEAARIEREALKKLRMEAEARGEEFEQFEGRFERRIKELNDMHQQRWSEQREALVRDRACRLELGLPIEEPGRYADKTFWGKTQYDPREPEWRNDYWGDPGKMKDDYRKEQEPRIRPATGADEEVEDVWDTEVAISVEGDLESRPQTGINYDDLDVRLILRESGNTEAVNGTATKALINPWDGHELTENSLGV